MIHPNGRFWTASTISYPMHGDGEERCTVIDTDRRREWYVLGPSKYLTDHETDVMRTQAAIINNLDEVQPNTVTISVDEDGDVWGFSSRPPSPLTMAGLDKASDIRMPLFSSAPTLAGQQTVGISALKEVDRLAPFFDLMQWPAGDENPSNPQNCGNPGDDGSKNSAGGSKVIFKYALLNYRAEDLWNEMHFLQCLPPHEHIRKMDRLVLRNTSRILGFTAKYIQPKYIDGADLAKGQKQSFKLKYLKQLTDTLDFLHFSAGVAHGNIRPSNILIDTTTDSIQLIDFGLAKVATEESIQEDLDKVFWTAYEIVTHDYQRRFNEPNARPKKWIERRGMSCTPASIQKHIEQWITRRSHQQIPERLVPEWPKFENDYLEVEEEIFGDAEEYAEAKESNFADMPYYKESQDIFSWERPPY
ncbi:kinase-like domain-containing protein [Pseudomassariella vexata]|uniref:Autophagy-related protein 1 n=1 Tax=Pseudomassariella vexata TaxID=1141098 RepID=A0A1Y2DBZ6_9PEZI|nr:kinase-like domain-containing protein [Pseudomassariella vexata]ORY56636.1 kinase-like domain-containing protein [Pseudomassariella vexata]